MNEGCRDPRSEDPLLLFPLYAENYEGNSYKYCSSGWAGKLEKKQTMKCANFLPQFKMKSFWLLVFAFFGAVVGHMDKEEAVAQCIAELAVDEGKVRTSASSLGIVITV